jgi:nucleoside-diphosphate-sugar epimerase
MRAVVTGGAGFIGSHVVDALLARGDEVHVLDDLSRGRRENVAEAATLHVADLAEADRVLDVARPGAVLHLAAQADVRVSVERPDRDAQVNVLGTLYVLEAARRHGAQVVFASTGGAIYGECEGPAQESAPRRPLAPYGTSKLCGEEYLATWNRLYGTNHVSLPFANVYGPRQEPHGEAGVVAIFMGLLLDGGTPRIYARASARGRAAAERPRRLARPARPRLAAGALPRGRPRRDVEVDAGTVSGGANQGGPCSTLSTSRASLHGASRPSWSARSPWPSSSR